MNKIFSFLLLFLGLAATAAADNVVTFPNVTGTPGSIITIEVNLANSDELSAFQFDIPLGNNLTFVANSCVLPRKDNHVVESSVLSGNLLRIMAYSFTNALIPGNDGAILKFDLELGETIGDNVISPNKSILADVTASPLAHTVIDGNVTISNSPHINCSTSLTMNPSSINVTATEIFAITNDGVADLELGEITFSGANAANCSVSGVPDVVPVGETAYVSVNYDGASAGAYSAVMTIESNSSGGSVDVAVSGTRYENGVAFVVPVLTSVNDDVVWSFELNNTMDLTSFDYTSWTIRILFPYESYTIEASDVVKGARVDDSETTFAVTFPSSGQKLRVKFKGTVSGYNGPLFTVTMHPVGGAKATENYNLAIDQFVVEDDGGDELDVDEPTSVTFTAYSDESAWTLPSGAYGEPGTFTECVNALNNVVGGGNLALNSDIVLSENLVIDPDIVIDYGTAKAVHSITVSHGVSLINYADVIATYLLHIDNSAYPDGAKWSADWHNVASPVSDYPVTDFVTGDYDFYRYNETTAVWENQKAHPEFTTMESGRGYLVAFDNERDMEFTGIMTHGNVAYPLTKTPSADELAGINLAGNPYPSYIDWHEIYDATLDIDNTYYVWDEDHAQYAAYTYSEPAVGTFDMSRYISPGQGFLVKCNNESGSILKFSDASRANKNQAVAPFRNEYTKIKVNVKGTAFGEDEAIVMMNCPRVSYAAKIASMYGISPSLYFPYAGNDCAIVLLDDEFAEESMPLAFKAGHDDEFTMVFDIDNYEGGYLELEDMLTGMKINLLENNAYTFLGYEDDPEARFKINFREIMAVEDVMDNNIFVYSDGNTLTINNLVEKSYIRVFDIKGVLMLEANANESTAVLGVSGLASGIYVVQITNNSIVSNKKVLIK